MLNRLKEALVESFVGAIALGWLFAQSIFHFANIFAAPFMGLITRREYRAFTSAVAAPPGLSFQDAVPEVVRCFVLLVVGYILLRWLYFTPVKKVTHGAEPNTEQAV